MLKALFYWLKKRLEVLEDAFTNHLKNPIFKNEPLAPDVEIYLDKKPSIDNTTIGEIEFGFEDSGFYHCSRLWSSYYNIEGENCGYLRLQTNHNKNSLLGLGVEPNYDVGIGWYNKINFYNNLLKNPMVSITDHNTKVGEIMVEIDANIYYIPIYI